VQFENNFLAGDPIFFAEFAGLLLLSAGPVARCRNHRDDAQVFPASGGVFDAFENELGAASGAAFAVALVEKSPQHRLWVIAFPRRRYVGSIACRGGFTGGGVHLSRGFYLSPAESQHAGRGRERGQGQRGGPEPHRGVKPQAFGDFLVSSRVGVYEPSGEVGSGWAGSPGGVPPRLSALCHHPAGF